MLDSFDAVTEIVAEQWDALAVELNRPYCAPAWVLAWRHLAPDGIKLRIIVVRDDDRVVAVAPFYAAPWRAGLWTWALMGSDNTSRIEPVADPEYLDAAGQAIADAIAAATPRPGRIRLEGIEPGSPWPDLLSRPTGQRESWSCSDASAIAPNVTLTFDRVDDFLSGRSANFRQQMRRHRRKVDKDRGEFRIASTPDEMERAIPDLVRLHHGRWDFRGGSHSVRTGTDEMLLAAGRELGPERFQLVSLVLDGKTINSQLFVSAGNEIAYWNGGFDNQYARYTPAQVALVEAIRMSIDAGHARFDLGLGTEPYKYRFTDTEDRIQWVTLIPRAGAYPLARLIFLPRQLRQSAAGLLSREQKARIRRLLRRPVP